MPTHAATRLSPGAILLIQLALALGGFAIGTGLGWTVAGYIGAVTAIAGLTLFACNR